MMKIHVSLKLFASLEQRMPDGSDRFAVSPGATIGDVLAELGIPEDDAKLVFINNRRADFSSILQDGDRVGVFPPVGGG